MSGVKGADEFKDMRYFMDEKGDRYMLSQLINVETFDVWGYTQYNACLIDKKNGVKIHKSVYKKLKAYLDSKTIM